MYGTNQMYEQECKRRAACDLWDSRRNEMCQHSCAKSSRWSPTFQQHTNLAFCSFSQFDIVHSFGESDVQVFRGCLFFKFELHYKKIHYMFKAACFNSECKIHHSDEEPKPDQLIHESPVNFLSTDISEKNLKLQSSP